MLADFPSFSERISNEQKKEDVVKFGSIIQESKDVNWKVRKFEGMLGHRSGQIIPKFGIIVLGNDENENEEVAHELHLHFRSNAIIINAVMFQVSRDVI